MIRITSTFSVFKFRLCIAKVLMSLLVTHKKSLRATDSICQFGHLIMTYLDSTETHITERNGSQGLHAQKHK